MDEAEADSLREPYSVSKTRYAKGKLVVRIRPDGTGFKTRAAYLIEVLGGRWVHRDHGYQVSQATANRFESLYWQGYSGSLFGKKIIDPPSQNMRTPGQILYELFCRSTWESAPEWVVLGASDRREWDVTAKHLIRQSWQPEADA